MHFQYCPRPSPSNIPIMVKAPYTINPTTSTISTEDTIWVYDCAQLKSFFDYYSAKSCRCRTQVFVK